MTRLQDLYSDQGQSPWLDNLQRGWLTSGELARWVERGVRGITSNPTIFQKAIANSPLYDEQFGDLVGRGSSVDDAYWDLVADDIEGALSLLRPVYDESGGVDGFVSLEVAPSLARDRDGTIASALELHARIDEPNLFVKIPATAEGVDAIRAVVSQGKSINVTLIFGLDRYADVIEAYLSGLEAYDGDLSKVASVASFFVSRVDAEVDQRLESIGTPDALDLRGKAAVANAQAAYQQLYRQRRAHGPATDRLISAETEVAETVELVVRTIALLRVIVIVRQLVTEAVEQRRGRCAARVRGVALTNAVVVVALVTTVAAVALAGSGERLARRGSDQTLRRQVAAVAVIDEPAPRLLQLPRRRVSQEGLSHAGVLAKSFLFTRELQERCQDGLDEDQRLHEIFPLKRQAQGRRPAAELGSSAPIALRCRLDIVGAYRWLRIAAAGKLVAAGDGGSVAGVLAVVIVGVALRRAARELDEREILGMPEDRATGLLSAAFGKEVLKELCALVLTSGAKKILVTGPERSLAALALELREHVRPATLCVSGRYARLPLVKRLGRSDRAAVSAALELVGNVVEDVLLAAHDLVDQRVDQRRADPPPQPGLHRARRPARLSLRGLQPGAHGEGPRSRPPPPRFRPFPASAEAEVPLVGDRIIGHLGADGRGGVDIKNGEAEGRSFGGCQSAHGQPGGSPEEAEMFCHRRQSCSFRLSVEPTGTGMDQVFN